jgi:glycosyltransferase 2 family protein
VVGLLRGVGDALAHARPGLVALALALHILGLVITGERWRLVIAALGLRLSLLRTVLINLAGIFVRNATPTTGLGGDASRILLLRSEGLPLVRATAAFGYVRLAEIPPIALVVAFSAPAVAAIVRRSSRALLIGAIVAAAVLLLLWIRRDWLRRQAAALTSDAQQVRIRRGTFAGAVVYAALAQVETIVRQIVVAAACGMSLSIQQSATITAMSIVGGFVPTVGSIGAIDGSIVAGLMLFGADGQTAITITLIERLISYGFSTAAGAAALATLGGRRVLAKYHGAR